MTMVDRLQTTDRHRGVQGMLGLRPHNCRRGAGVLELFGSLENGGNRHMDMREMTVVVAQIERVCR